MKLLLITADITIMGGIERVISKITKSLAENYNYEIEIVSLYKNYKNGHKPQFELFDDIKISYYDIDNKSRDGKNKIDTFILLIKYYYMLIKNIKKILNSKNADIVITFHTPISIASIINKKYIKGKLIVTEHSDYYNCSDKIAMILRRILFKKANRVVVLTESSKKIYDEFTDNVLVIPNPVSFESKNISNLNNKRIISAGRLEVEKGFDQLIEAFEIISDKNPGWKLDIFGEGNEQNNLINMINIKGLNSKVKIHPFTNNLREEMLKSDIYAIPSRSEAFSLVALEAMECGLPLLSFNTAGPQEIIDNNKCGIIVKGNDVEKFSKELDKLMKSRDERLKYANNAKSNIKKYYINNILEVWNKLFKDTNM